MYLRSILKLLATPPHNKHLTSSSHSRKLKLGILLYYTKPNLAIQGQTKPCQTSMYISLEVFSDFHQSYLKSWLKQHDFRMINRVGKVKIDQQSRKKSKWSTELEKVKIDQQSRGSVGVRTYTNCSAVNLSKTALIQHSSYWRN